jgi:hypothetical protein
LTITDLPGLVLARNNGNAIDLDRDAAGHGWFVDPTPGDDSEFDADGQALAGSDAEGDIDLLTVVTHELGHVLGFDHGTGPIMADTLSTGVRLQASGDSSADVAASDSNEPKTLIFKESLGRLFSAADAAYVDLFSDTDFDGTRDDLDLDGRKDFDFIFDDTIRNDARKADGRTNGNAGLDETKSLTEIELSESTLDDADDDIPGTKLQRQLPAPDTGLISWTRHSGITDQLFNFLDT